MSFAGTPPKNSNAATCASVHARWVMLTAGRTNRCREYGSTIENAHSRRRPARRRIRPQPQVPVIHLGLGSRRHRRPGHPHLRGPRPFREMRPHVPAHAGHARLESLLVGQPLVDHRHRHHPHQSGDPVVIQRDLAPGHLPHAGAGDLREPAAGPAPATAPRLTGGPPGAIPAASAGATYRRTVLASTPRLRATSTFGRPAYQCCRISVTSTMVNVLLAISALRPEADERHTQLEGPGAEPLRARRRLGKTLIEGVGNYLIAAGP